MDNETRIKLLEAGYTKEEIEAGEKTEDAKGKSDEAIEKSDEAKGKSDEAKGKSADADETNYKEIIEKLTISLDGLSKTVKALQENNQKTAKIPEDEDVPKSADEVIKGFIENM